MARHNPSRGLAYAMLRAVKEDRVMLADFATPERYSTISTADAARANRIALATLRWAGRADALLAPLLKTRVKPPVRTLLQMGVAELCVHGEAAHGVVNDCVGIARANRKLAPAAGLINAVLRKVAETGPSRWADLPLPQVHGPFRARLLAAWGGERLADMEAVFCQRPPVDLSMKSVPSEGLEAETLPNGSLRLHSYRAVSELPGYEAGEWWVQDAAAAMMVPLLGEVSGARVLDLCAAPGGKTMQLAAAGADVTAVDVSADRLERVQQNLARTGLAAKVVTSDALAFSETGWDAIVLDAPCSATGTLRRHPDLAYVKTDWDLAPLTALQAALLDHAWHLLKSGGRLLYCTCSLDPAEGEAQVTAFLGRHASAQVKDVAHLPWVEPDWIASSGGVRLLPCFWRDKGGMDGFFGCVLEKPA